MTDPEARDRIKREFYEAYQKAGLHVLVSSSDMAQKLGLDAAQTRRCLDYLSAKDLIRPMTLDGRYIPTVDLVDDVERSAGAAQ